MDFSFGFGLGSSAYLLSGYNPHINYDWSTTTTGGLRYLRDIGGTPTYNASMYFGRGAYFNGVDQTITVPINTTIQTALKRVNGIVTINETSQTLTNYVISGLGVHKDYYLFTRLLTTAEKDSYTNTPELFYAMAQADSTCVLNMPMCENSSTSRNYKTGIDYSITNYTSSVRDNAKRLQYGLQTCKFVRDSSGVIQSASNYLECDGAGYATTGWTPDLTKKLSIEFIVKNNDNLTENILIGCIDGPTTRLALGFRGTNARILLGNVYPQYAIASTVYYGTLTMTGIAGQSIVYINGEYKGLVGESTLGNPLSMFWLGGTPLASYKKIDTRLFKVHNKVLTQAEITANYNRYVSQGVLS